MCNAGNRIVAANVFSTRSNTIEHCVIALYSYSWVQCNCHITELKQTKTVCFVQLFHFDSMATKHLERFISKRLRILTTASDSMSVSSKLPIGTYVAIDCILCEEWPKNSVFRQNSTCSRRNALIKPIRCHRPTEAKRKSARKIVALQWKTYASRLAHRYCVVCVCVSSHCSEYNDGDSSGNVERNHWRSLGGGAFNSHENVGRAQNTIEECQRIANNSKNKNPLAHY